jgi:hypothetical protein
VFIIYTALKRRPPIFSKTQFETSFPEHLVFGCWRSVCVGFDFGYMIPYFLLPIGYFCRSTQTYPKISEKEQN